MSDSRYRVTYTGSDVVRLGSGGKFMQGTSAWVDEATAREAAAHGDFTVEGLDEASAPAAASKPPVAAESPAAASPTPAEPKKDEPKPAAASTSAKPAETKAPEKKDEAKAPEKKDEAKAPEKKPEATKA
jgi:hypothetical protein